MLTKNYNYETIKRLEGILNKKHISDVRNDLHKALLEEGHKFIDNYEFKKTGLLNRTVERKIYRDMDTDSILIVDIGQDYEENNGSYTPYYYICVYVVDEELNQYGPELYYEY